jgi:hypothetical protein
VIVVNLKGLLVFRQFFYVAWDFFLKAESLIIIVTMPMSKPEEEIDGRIGIKGVFFRSDTSFYS